MTVWRTFGDPYSATETTFKIENHRVIPSQLKTAPGEIITCQFSVRILGKHADFQPR